MKRKNEVLRISDFFIPDGNKKQKSDSMKMSKLDTVERSMKRTGSISSSSERTEILDSNNAFLKLMNGRRGTFWLVESNGKYSTHFCFSGEKPPDCPVKWKSSVSCKHFWDVCENETYDLDIRLATNISSDSEIFWNQLLSSEVERFLPLIKSLLQKSVRRRYQQMSFDLSILLMSFSFQEFIRRCIIICLEDAFLHPGIPILVWLMMASSKSFVPDCHLRLLCALMVSEWSGSTYRDVRLDEEQIACLQSDIGKKKLNLSKISNSSLRTLLLAMGFRRCYGGMSFDMNLLKNCSIQWLWRWECDSSTLLNTNSSSVKNDDDNRKYVVPMEFYLSSSYLDELDHSAINYWNCFRRCFRFQTEDCLVDVVDQSNVSASSTEGIHNELGKSRKRLPEELTNILNIFVERNSIIDGFLSSSGIIEDPMSIFVNSIRKAILNSSNFLLEGVDFHCCGGMISEVLNRHEDEISSIVTCIQDEFRSNDPKDMNFIDGRSTSFLREKYEQAIKECIWSCRSSFNYHEYLNFDSLNLQNIAQTLCKNEKKDFDHWYPLFELIESTITLISRRKINELKMALVIWGKNQVILLNKG